MSIPSIKGWAIEANRLCLHLEGGRAFITLHAGGAARLQFEADGAQPDPLPATGANANLMLADEPAPLPCAAEESAGVVVLRAPGVAVRVERRPFRLTLLGEGDRPLLTSAARFLEHTPGQTILRFALAAGEHIYGLGQDPMAQLDQRDRERRVFHQYGHIRRSGNIAAPFLMSSAGYGLFLHSGRPARFEIGAAQAPEYDRLGFLMAEFPARWPTEAVETDPDTTAILLDDDRLDLFLLAGERSHDYDALLATLHSLTGRPALLPKWAYGYVQCNCRYRSQEEIEWLADTMRARDVPCDVLLIDWLWFREFGDMAWDERAWPDPAAMFRRLAAQGFQVMMAQHPFVSEKSCSLADYQQRGYLNQTPPGERLTYDHTNPEARDYWWREKLKPFVDQGLKGYWTDMGELEEHHQGTTSQLGSRDDVHNLYMTLWTRGLAEGQRRDCGTRFFALTRAHFPGMGRYGAALWSGDIDARWEVMAEQVVIGQGVAMSGIPYWTTDIGGFLTVDGFTPELFIRWLQWNVFCPIFRVHGTRPGNELWALGPQTEAIGKRYAARRYQLFPYIYSLAYQLRLHGTPLMRPMAMDFGDQPCAAATAQFMFGPALLIAPVVERSARAKQAALPEGLWYDFDTDRCLVGGVDVTLNAPLEHIPVLVRAGSILPLRAEVVTHNACTPELAIDLHIWPGADGSFTFYDDEGEGYAYEDGAYDAVQIAYRESGEQRALHLQPVHSGLTPPVSRRFTAVFHGLAAPCGLRVHDREAAFVYDEVADTWRVDLGELGHAGCRLACSAASIPVALAPARFFADTDLGDDGELAVQLCWENAAWPSDAEVIAELRTGDAWSIRFRDESFHNSEMYSRLMRHQREQRQAPLGTQGSLGWRAFPCAAAMPVTSSGEVRVRVAHQGQTLLEQCFPLRWGSGSVTRFALCGPFDNAGNAGFATAYPPEQAPLAAAYAEAGYTLAWTEDPAYEHNCFGYMELRRYGTFTEPDGEGIHGVTYARTRVFAPDAREAFLRLSAETGIRIWLNGEPVFTHDGVVIDARPAQPLPLCAGENLLLVKTCVRTEKPYSGREFGFRLQLVDATGEPQGDLLYAR